MALQEQVVPISFGNGLDTKTDPKAVQAKVLQLYDGVFTNPNRISKRNGNSALTLSIEGGGTISSPLMSKSYNNELLIADGTNLYSYTPNTGTGAWINKGPYPSVSVTDKFISAFSGNGSSQLKSPTCANLGNYTLFVYTTTSLGVYASLVDNTTGAFLIQDKTIDALAQFPTACLLSGTTLGVIYCDASEKLQLSTVAFSSSGASFNSPVQIGSNVNSSNPNIYVSSNASFNFVTYAYSSGGVMNAIGIQSISSSGSIISSTFFSLAYTPSFIVSKIDASNNIWIYWVNASTPTSETIYYAIYSSSLSSVLNTTSIIGSLEYITNISPNNQISGNQYLYYSTNTQSPSSSSPNYVTTQYAEISKTAVVSSGNSFLFNLEIESNWVSYLGSNYVVMANVPGNRLSQGSFVGEQNTFFLIKENFVSGLPTPLPVGKCLSGSAVVSEFDSLYISGTSVVFGAPFVLFNDIIQTSNALVKTPLTGVQMVTFNFDDFESYQSVQAGNTTILNGGIVQMYDGKYVVELGFNVFPENITTSFSSSGGGITNSSGSAVIYTYAATYEWYDSTGNFHVSAPQFTSGVSVANGTTAGSVSITVQTLTLTQKTFPNTQAVNICLYRTLANGSIFYKVFETPNNVSATTVSITDTVPDSSITGLADIELYTTGGVVENIAPPPAMVMAVINNRLNLVNSESPTNNIWYSKTYNPGTGISMSDLLTITIDPRFSNITSLAGMDANYCVLKQGGVFVFTGDGSDDTGQNSSFTNPQVVPTDVGCLYSRGTILTPDGVMFKTNKGIYLLSRGLSISYFGADVEAFNSQNIESALIAPNTSQTRFLTSSGYSLVYDYIFKQWGVFSNYQGYSSTIWNGNYVYCRTDGSVYQENTTTFLDGTTPYSLTIQLAWMKFGGIQGFQRIRNCLALGDHISPVSGHGIQISAAYDFVQSFGAAIGYSLPIQPSNSVFQYREFFPRQKCDSLGLLIQEITTGTSGEYLDLTDLSLNIGVKRGLNKVAAAVSVG